MYCSAFEQVVLPGIRRLINASIIIIIIIMEDGRIPKDIIYGELALGRRTTGRPHLRYKDVCIRDMKAVDIDTMSWEGLAANRTEWRSALKLPFRPLFF